MSGESGSGDWAREGASTAERYAGLLAPESGEGAEVRAADVVTALGHAPVAVTAAAYGGLLGGDAGR